MERAVFSASSLFADSDATSTGFTSLYTFPKYPQLSPLFADEETNEEFLERKHNFPGMELVVREFSFHQMNANLLRPGTFSFAEWIVDNKSLIQGRRVLELGSGTGALAIFLHKSFEVDITTSDYDDPDIEGNIAYNCQVNGVVPALPHITHTWGETFPVPRPDWDLIIASDILLYVKQYGNLIKTLSFLLKPFVPQLTEAVPRCSEPNDTSQLARPAFLMSWRRRIGKEDESLFFTGCEKAGLLVGHLGSRVYSITLWEEASN